MHRTEFGSGGNSAQGAAPFEARFAAASMKLATGFIDQEKEALFREFEDRLQTAYK